MSKHNQQLAMRNHFNKLVSICKLLRLPNAVALAALFLGTAGGQSAGLDRAVVGAAGWLIAAAFSYVYNDVCDVEIDRVNRPSRPLPSGVVSIEAAAWLSWILAALGITLGIAAGHRYGGWIICGILGSIIYSRTLRGRSSLASNLAAAGLVSCVPLSALARVTVPGIALVVGIGVAMLAREMQKDLLDFPGDAAHRPPPVLVSYSFALGRAGYAALPITAALLLTYALSASGLGRGGTVMACMVVLPLCLASLVHLAGYGQPRFQVGMTKLASYFLVCALLLSRRF